MLDGVLHAARDIVQLCHITFGVCFDSCHFLSVAIGMQLASLITVWYQVV